MTQLSLLMNNSKYNKSYSIKLCKSRTSFIGPRKSRSSTGTRLSESRLIQPPLIKKFKMKITNTKS